MSAAKERLDLLLAGDDGKPTLEEGLQGDSVERAPRQKMPGHNLRLHGGDASDLPAQRWGILAPEGRVGDRMLEAIQPLQRLREAEQGAPATIFRVPSEMRARDAKAWKDSVYAGLEEEEQPYYLMLLGDMHHTALELQHVLSNDALVGRVHFADESGEVDLARYAAYADKVLRYARYATPEPAADLLYYAAPDGSAATNLGKRKLIEPSFERSTEALAGGKSTAASVRNLEAETVSELLESAGGARPSVLLSVSHGLGAPRRGWKSEEEQWRRQGAMMIGPGEVLDAERLHDQPFLPGGMWFFTACFGVGTPRESAYHPWLSELRKVDAFRGDVEAVLANLPGPNERGFLAALPQAALANPAGPLAVIGHIDLAWTYAFTGGANRSESKEARIRILLNMLLRGSRVGVALNKLMDDYREANQALTASYDTQERARIEGRPSPIAPAELAHQWMLRNDLRGYVVLGDPAAQLPLQQFARQAAVIREPEPPEVRTDVGSVPVPIPAVDKEQVVLETLCGEEAPKVIAARAGIPLSTLWMWVEAYRAGGRSRLGE
jgi:hypothetical protein